MKTVQTNNNPKIKENSMKSSTYTKKVNDLSEKLNSKMGENAMKTVPCLWEKYNNIFDWDKISNESSKLWNKSIAYQKTDNGVKKIDKNRNNELLQAYNRINKELKTGKWTFTLDNLHNAYLSTLNTLDKVQIKDSNSLYQYLIKACYNRLRDDYRSENNFQVLKDQNCEYVVESRENGITDIYINQVIKEIEKRLDGRQMAIFELKYIKGFTYQEMVESLDNSTLTGLKREVQSIDLKIFSLKIAYFLDTRYELYQGHGKRRHLRYDDHIEDSGIGYKRDISEYEPMSFEPETIPKHKALSYPTKQYYLVQRDDFSYSDKGSKAEKYFITNRVLGHCKVEAHKNTIEEVK